MPRREHPPADPAINPESLTLRLRPDRAATIRVGLPRTLDLMRPPVPDPTRAHRIGQLARTLAVGAPETIQAFEDQLDRQILSVLDQWCNLVQQTGFPAILADLALIDDAIRTHAGEDAEPGRRAWVSGLLDRLGRRLGTRPTWAQTHTAIEAAVAGIDDRYPALIEAFEAQTRVLEALLQTHHTLSSQREATEAALATLAAPSAAPQAGQGPAAEPERRTRLDRRLSRLRLLDRTVSMQIQRVRDFQQTQSGLDQALRRLLDQQLPAWIRDEAQAGPDPVATTDAADMATRVTTDGTMPDAAPASPTSPADRADADGPAGPTRLASLQAGVGALLEVGRAFTAHCTELADHIRLQRAGLHAGPRP